ncbi:uncharacterized protein RAG0_12082 [Rhynchosporium agropyri]|uniref:Uncharacterized protein n=1 Tax=Rhynchosporium agropyri TaxID=914238 RepID=A0A1E1L722_9HELO|nr:uncharacterized protein RAG0_12082 [Rhynchosporium agropyri]
MYALQIHCGKIKPSTLFQKLCILQDTHPEVGSEAD